MDPFRNPFSPGAGCRPPELAGREEYLNFALTSCGRLLRGNSGRPMMMLGLRGTGKTVLLREIARQVAERDFLVSMIESPEKDSLAALLYPQIQKVLRSFSTIEKAKSLAKQGLSALQRFACAFRIDVGGIEVSFEPTGVADTGKLELDLPDLFEAVGKAAKAAGKGWIVLIDEVQYLNSKDLSALLVALHRMNQLELPVMFVGAGLPNVAKLAGDAKSYAERLFRFCEIGPLGPDDVRRAVENPIKEAGASITGDALEALGYGTRGYPFFLQEWASQTWNLAEGSCITLTDLANARNETIRELDQGFFRVRLDRLTPQEISFVEAMAQRGPGPYGISEIAEAMGKTTSQISPLRARIAKKGMIYSPRHGLVAFTVPLFDEFLLRQKKEAEIMKGSEDKSGKTWLLSLFSK